MAESETFIPLNDVKTFKRVNSKGSGLDVGLAEEGRPDTPTFRIQAVDPTANKKISLWHDISLVHVDPETKKETPYLNFVCEIPKFTRYVPTVGWVERM